MPSTYTSPYATAFKAAMKRGTSYNTAVNSIAGRSSKSTEQVWNSLYKAGLCFRQKFNGQWIYFPWDISKSNSTTWKNSQFNSWQWFTEWCITSGNCRPEQFKNNCGSQKEFMTWCRKYFGKQFSGNNSPARKSGRTRKTAKTRTRKSSKSSSIRSSYKFSKSGSRKSARSYRRAA